MTAGKVTKIRKSDPPEEEGPPATLLIGPKVYEIRVDADGLALNAAKAGECSVQGFTDTESQIIWLSPGLAQDSLCETLMHEIRHAILDIFDESDLPGRINERVCRACGFADVSLFRDNPDLVDFLRSGGAA